jgi:hypothetical protein
VGAQQIDRGNLGFADEIEGAGQEGGDGPGPGHGRGAGFVEIFQVVRRQGGELRGQGRPMQVGQLLGVQLDRQAVGPGGLEHPAGLGGRKTDALAEGVDGVGQAFGGDGRDHPVANEVDIAVRIAGEFRRQGVGAQEGGGDRHVPLVAQGAGGAQLFALGLDG